MSRLHFPVATETSSIAREIGLASGSRRQLLRYALAGAAAVLLPACNGSSGLAAGDHFPEIDLPYLDGHAVPFAPPAGVPLIINFWASWCEPCREEMPSLEKLSRIFRPEELLVIGVTVDSDVNLAREFSLRGKLTFPMLSDSGLVLASRKLHIPVFPATFLLQRDRTIARVTVGARDWASPTMVKEIEGLLAVRRSTPA